MNRRGFLGLLAALPALPLLGRFRLEEPGPGPIKSHVPISLSSGPCRWDEIHVFKDHIIARQNGRLHYLAELVVEEGDTVGTLNVYE